MRSRGRSSLAAPLPTHHLAPGATPNNERQRPGNKRQPRIAITAMITVLDSFLVARAPPWYRTPKAQTATLGIVFFWVFTAWTTIQFYSRSTYGAELAADCVSAVYFTFTLMCLVSPGIINKWGCRLCMFVGVLGYAPIVLTSLVYFLYGGEDVLWARRLVVLAGAAAGCGAATLWTAQGRLILQYASRAEELGAASPARRASSQLDGDGGGTASNTCAGELMGFFWAIFQLSGLVGGAISFLYYDRQQEGSAALYVLFLSFIVAGALFTQLLLPPSMLENEKVADNRTAGIHDQHEADVEDMSHDEGTPLSAESSSDYTRMRDSSRPADGHDTKKMSEELSHQSWRQEARETFKLAFTKRMMCLSPLFFYTGFNQPYQQATFGNRFFTKRSIGAELIVFHLMEIAGAIICGRFLDGRDRTTPGAHRRKRAAACLAAFAVINAAGNALALAQERAAARDPSAPAARDIADWRVLPPSLAFACWGFADAQIQVYCYWLMGSWYSSGGDHSRAVGWYKCVQSLGTSIGFFLIPTSRLGEMSQLACSSVVFIFGIALAFSQLPSQ